MLAYPDMLGHGRDVAIPLRMLARYWVAYYWAFVDESNVLEKQQARRTERGAFAKKIRLLWTE